MKDKDMERVWMDFDYKEGESDDLPELPPPYKIDQGK